MKYKVINKGKLQKRLREMIIIALIIIAIGVMYNQKSESEIVGYTYDSGNTVWELAEKHCPSDIDIREVMDEIEKVNDIQNSTIYRHMSYKVPVYQIKR